MKAFAVELEGLLEQDFVLLRPFVGEGREVGQVDDGLLEIVLVPEKHAERLLGVVAVRLLGHRDVLLELALWNLTSRRPHQQGFVCVVLLALCIHLRHDHLVILADADFL